VEAGHLGGPDIGLMTMTELLQQAERITDTVDIPVICDVDTGFGGIQNIHRTVRSAEKVGLAGLHIEDQTLPKKCPALPERKLVSIAEAVDRIAIAVDARTNPDFVVDARTVGDSVSYDDQITRANAYLAAGADVIMPMMIEHHGEMFSSLDPDRQMAIISRAVTDIQGPIMHVGNPPQGHTGADLAALGVKIVSPAAITIEAAANAMRDGLAEYRKSFSTAAYYADKLARISAGGPILDIVRLGHYLELEERFGRSQG
jgi:methylisocitrate lyase